MIEALSGAPFDVRFLSFDDLKAGPQALEGVDVLLNVGGGDTAHTGGAVWEDPDISSAVKRFVWNGGGFIGVGEPSGHLYQGRYFQMAQVLGTEKETGFTLGYDKYNWEEHPEHFILADAASPVDFGEGYSTEGYLCLGGGRGADSAGQRGPAGGECVWLRPGRVPFGTALFL